MLAGIYAGIAFGLSDLIAAVLAPRIGTTRVVVGILTSSVVLLAAVALVGGHDWASTANSAPWIALSGVAAGLAYALFIYALRLGPVSVISPIGAASGATVGLLTLVVLGETMTGGQLAMLVLIAVGCVMGVSGSRPTRSAAIAAPALAVVAVFLNAAAIVIIRDPIRQFGWLEVLVVWRGASLGAAVTILLAMRLGNRPGWTRGEAHSRARIFTTATALLVLASLLEVSGQAMRAFGLATAPAWLIGIVMSVGPTVPVVGAVVLLGERLRPRQWAGIVAVFGGICLIETMR